MKKTLALLAVLFALAAPASDTYYFTLASTNPTADTSNGVSEILNPGGTYAVQCDGQAYIRTSVGTGTTGVAATTNDVKLSADQLYDVDLTGGQKFISALAASGTVNCRVFKVVKRAN